MWVEKTVPIRNIAELLDEGYEVEVESPDGFVPVNFFVDKGTWDEYELRLLNGTVVRCNENHMFETALGWQYAKDLVGLPDQHYLTREGFVVGYVHKTENKIPIVDINVDHDNHRYYTDGVSSHNTGVGKSISMCHMAASFLKQNYNVLYISLEMDAESIGERIDANLMRMDMNDLWKQEKSRFLSKINHLFDQYRGKLIIKQYPTASASVVQFRSLLNELEVKKKFKPDIIFIDYLNIAASSRFGGGISDKTHITVKAIAEEIRGLAIERDVPIVSATQPNRSGYGDSDMDITHISDSFGIAYTVDLLIALIETPELFEMGQIMVKQLKNRYRSAKKLEKFIIGIDKAKSTLYNVEESVDKDLISNKMDTGPIKPNKDFSSIKF